MASHDHSASLFRGLHPVVLHASLALGILASAASWWWYVGPFRWATQLQLALLNAEYLSLSACLDVAMCMLGFGAIAKCLTLARLLPKGDPDETFDPAVNIGNLQLAIYGACALAAGAYLFVVIDPRPNARDIDAAAIESGADAPSVEKVRIHGNLREDLSVSTKRDRIETLFIPLISPSLTPGSPISVVLACSAKQSHLPDASPSAQNQPPGAPPAVEIYSGVIEPGGVPHLAMEAFESKGIDVSQAVLLRYRGDLMIFQVVEMLSFVIGGGVVLVAAARAGYSWLQARANA